jgi:hypothetical protein
MRTFTVLLALALALVPFGSPAHAEPSSSSLVVPNARMVTSVLKRRGRRHSHEPENREHRPALQGTAAGHRRCAVRVAPQRRQPTEPLASVLSGSSASGRVRGRRRQTVRPCPARLPFPKLVKRPSLAKIGWILLRYGNLTFGGGTATIAVLDREIVERVTSFSAIRRHYHSLSHA